MRAVILAAGLLASTTAQAISFDFLSQSKPEVNDGSVMVTLEAQQTEMFPKVSPDGRYLLVVAQQERDGWLSRRAINGDPLNELTHDSEAIASANWHNDEVSFLSHRAGGEGLWAERADGQGLLHRVRELSGHLTQTILLGNGNLIAVRLLPTGERNAGMGHPHDDFVNWDFPGYQPYIVRIDTEGAEHRLSQGINPALSPDGQWIAFALPVGRSFHVCIMRTDGSELTELSSGRYSDVQPAWTADGRNLLFTSDRIMEVKDEKDGSHKGDWHIWMVDRHGGNLARITATPGRNGAPAVAADGSVYFHSDRKADTDLKARRGIRGSNAGGFHIWRIQLPPKQ